jgi:hypothetical protein
LNQGDECNISPVPERSQIVIQWTTKVFIAAIIRMTCNMKTSPTAKELCWLWLLDMETMHCSDPMCRQLRICQQKHECNFFHKRAIICGEGWSIAALHK